MVWHGACITYNQTAQGTPEGKQGQEAYAGDASWYSRSESGEHGV
jgi:hypothetical protein